MASVNARRAKRSRPGKVLGRTPAGDVITEAVAAELAEEAERGYDLSTLKPERIGRPSLGGTGASPRIGFRAAPDLYRAAKARAKREGRTVSELAREALAKYIAE